MPAPAPRPHLRGETPLSLAQLWPDLELDLGTARRVVHRLVQADADDLVVRGLSHRRRDALLSRGRLERLHVVDRRLSPSDGFLKYLLRAPDGVLLETVRIPLDKPRYSVCVSSQAGCAMGCGFCETGRLGLARHLEAWEMVEQVLRVRREATDRPVTGVVFQGQGEPLHNYEAVMRAAAILRDPSGGRIGGDRITISTVGLPDAIRRYTDDGHPYRLILSLISAHDERRRALVPLARRHSVAELAEAIRHHAQRRQGLVHLGWVLLAGVNTGEDEARELARLFRGVRVRLSLIDVNDPSGRFHAPSDAERRAFMGALSAHGLAFVRRYSGGAEIAAACGTLASSARGGRALLEARPGPNVGDV